MDARTRLRAGSKTTLEDEGARQKPLSSSDKAADKQEILALSEKIALLQNVLYAGDERKVLVVLQGMDTSGKDGTVAGVFGRIDPLGVRCVPFKAPSPDELAHDFLWRVHQQVPARRELVIFNRSHYEDVLVPVVHGTIDQHERKRRYAQIRDFERLLAESGTLLLKFFLHISKDEQKKRLEERLRNPEKHWKFDPNDLLQRKLWEPYQQAYQEAIRETDAAHAPWYVIPADSKTHRNLAVANIVLDALEEMKLRYPPARPEYANLKVD